MVSSGPPQTKLHGRLTLHRAQSVFLGWAGMQKLSSCSGDDRPVFKERVICDRDAGLARIWPAPRSAASAREGLSSWPSDPTLPPLIEQCQRVVGDVDVVGSPEFDADSVSYHLSIGVELDEVTSALTAALPAVRISYWFFTPLEWKRQRCPHPNTRWLCAWSLNCSDAMVDLTNWCRRPRHMHRDRGACRISSTGMQRKSIDVALARSRAGCFRAVDPFLAGFLCAVFCANWQRAPRGTVSWP